ncbi:PASTA domain-containing protein [Marinibactrum halimedae]|uniref:PASTA domain-containing protein n=1 Tax=Marinibactrum halimedae TaxID=1444977 RepID=A0AA37WKB2_9GAMM|nr:PASTA domain-containing protein [Marinibactrum halimedae]MCD9460277.1 PASTA domain-containing protein [Marinibactrum halimedae]GLS24364.1 hypothetical protein GCM10007877_00750 [Marinibactrum halimedae]
MISQPVIFLQSVQRSIYQLRDTLNELPAIREVSYFAPEVQTTPPNVQSVRDYIDEQHLVDVDRRTRVGLYRFYLMLFEKLSFCSLNKPMSVVGFFEQHVQISLQEEERKALGAFYHDFSQQVANLTLTLEGFLAQLFLPHMDAMDVGLPQGGESLRAQIFQNFFSKLPGGLGFIHTQLARLAQLLTQLKGQVDTLQAQTPQFDFPEFKQGAFIQFDEEGEFLRQSQACLTDLLDWVEKLNLTLRDVSIPDSVPDKTSMLLEAYYSLSYQLLSSRLEITDQLQTFFSKHQELLHFLDTLSSIDKADFRPLPAPEKTNANSIISETGQVLSRVNNTIALSGYQVANVDMELKVVTNQLGEPVSISSLKEKDQYTSDQVGTMKFSLVKSGVNKGAQSEQKVPDVVGDTENYARSKLIQYGFKPFVQYRLTRDDSQDGRVIEQSPEPLSAASSGASVGIEIGRYVSGGLAHFSSDE